MSSKSTIEFAEIRALLNRFLKIRLTKSSIYYYIKEGGFPLPVGLARPRKWYKHEIVDWIKKRIALKK